MKKSGFTLVEILTVIAIIGILSLLIMPNFIENFKNASNGAVKIQQNQVIDATGLFLNDYCSHPLGQNKGLCNVYSLETNDSNKRYTCIYTLQTTSYLDPIMFEGANCTGFVIYNNNYKKIKPYLICGNKYQAEDIDDIKDKNGNSIKDLCG